MMDVAARTYKNVVPIEQRTSLRILKAMTVVEDKAKSIQTKIFKKYVTIVNRRIDNAFFDAVLFSFLL